MKITDKDVLRSLLRLASDDNSWKVKAHTIKGSLSCLSRVPQGFYEVQPVVIGREGVEERKRKTKRLSSSVILSFCWVTVHKGIQRFTWGILGSTELYMGYTGGIQGVYRGFTRVYKGSQGHSRDIIPSLT